VSSGGSDGAGFRPSPYKGCVRKDFVVEVTANRGQPPRRKASARSKPSLFRGELFRCHVVFIAFNWQLWNEIYLALQVFVMSFL